MRLSNNILVKLKKKKVCLIMLHTRYRNNIICTKNYGIIFKFDTEFIQSLRMFFISII